MARNSLPHSFSLPTFYCHAFECFREFCSLVPDIDLLSMTTKKIYIVFIQSSSVPARIVSLYPNIKFWVYFRRIDSNILENNVQKFSLLLYTSYIIYW